MGMNVNLTPQLEDLVRRQGLCASGLYTSASEVIREALRLLEEQDRLREVKLGRLREDIRKGLDSGPSEAWDAAQTKREARARRTSKAEVPRVTRRPLATADICEIWDRIADDSVDAADRWLDRLDDKFALLATHPLMGRARSELAQGLRELSVRLLRDLLCSTRRRRRTCACCMVRATSVPR